jgi:membrane-bound lytic murein transglycosylase A
LQLKILTGLLAGLALSLLACEPHVSPGYIPPETPILLQERNFPPCLIDDGDRQSLMKALERSLAYLESIRSTRNPPSPFLSPAGDFFSRERVRHTLNLLREIFLSTSTEGEMTQKVRENFVPVEFTQKKANPSILLSGYYEPVLEGSLEPGGEYQYPIYRRPDDLIAVPSEEIPGNASITERMVRLQDGSAVPYYSRREIDSEGVLRGKGLELAWLKDPWDCFVLHIQGSGQIRLADGRTMKVGFAASNGRPYRSIGKYLVDRGFLSENAVTMERIREFLQENPDRAEEIYRVNERYVFFRPLSEPEGPMGALGVPLTPGRSIATDLTVFPPGAPAYLFSRQPVLDEEGRIAGWKPLLRIVFNQDTGAAMRGPWRVDLFLGSGDKAGMAAGEMKEEGRIYFLLAK